MEAFNRDSSGLGDAGCVASVIDPAALETSTHPARVELEGTSTRGETVVDQRPVATVIAKHWQAPMNTSIEVATDVDHQRYCRLFLETPGT